MPSMRTLFGSPGSGSAAIEMALHAAGAAYQSVRASSWEPGPGLEALRRVNPLAQIPTLVEPDGTVLTESAAILLHLALSFPDAGLLPSAPGPRARALRGLVFIAANCYAAVSISDYPQRWTASTSGRSRENVRIAARANLHRAWDLFADAHAADPMLAIPAPGALAFLAVVVSQWSGTRAHLKSSRPAFHRLLIELERHPRIAPVLGEHRAA